MSRPRCSAIVVDGSGQCRLKARRDGLCWHHLRTRDKNDYSEARAIGFPRWAAARLSRKRS